MMCRLLWIALLFAIPVAGQALAGDLVVVVNPDRLEELGRDEVAQIYLKKRRFWGNGDRIVPVNRNSESDARERFARAIFGDNARQLPRYWNRQYFQGVLPPATLASDEAVRRFVASEPRAIGYIDAALVDDSVRVVLHIGD